ncbi:MAG: hypothetical protein M3327_03290 [Actinomycetota bacterium]|nr:hypothetical protein [Actinomycetota bacterium]
MTGTTKLLLTLGVVGIAGATAGLGAYSAFTATTNNTGNTITAGTVVISQHAGATTLYAPSADQGPSSTPIEKCVRVTYGGSLPASVKVYLASGAVTNGDKFNIKVERGSGLTTLDSSMSCAGFTASSTAFNTATLSSFQSNHNAFSNGIDGKAGGAAWSNGNSVDYRFTINVVDDPTPNAHTSAYTASAHTFTWEAQSN